MVLLPCGTEIAIGLSAVPTEGLLGSVVIVDVEDLTIKHSMDIQAVGSIRDMQWLPSGGGMLVLGEDGCVRLLDLHTLDVKRVVESPFRNVIQTMQLLPNGEGLAIV